MATKSSKTRKPTDAAAKAEPMNATVSKPITTPKAGTGPKDTASAGRSPRKAKRIRGTFSIPESDYALIGELKSRLKARKLPAKKNQLFRAGLHALAAMAPIELQEAIESLSATQKTPRKK